MTEAFINSGLTYAFKTYLKAKNRPLSPAFNSFLVVTLRFLCKLYNEADLVNAYLEKNTGELYAILGSYGALKNQIDELLININGFYKWALNEEKSQNNSKPKEFILVQEILIDMLILKMTKLKITPFDFYGLTALLYIDNNPDPNFKLFSYAIAENPHYIQHYLDTSLSNLNTKNNCLILKQDEEELLKNIPKRTLLSNTGAVNFLFLLSFLLIAGTCIFVILNLVRG